MRDLIEPRRNRITLRRREFLVGLGAVGLAACTPAVTTPKASATAAASKGPAQNLTIGLKADIIAPSPIVQGSTQNMLVLNNVYDPLLRFGADGKLGPGIAESWKAIDPLTYEFKIRSGAKYHNGTPVTAETVKYSIDQAVDPKSGSTIKPPFQRAGASWQVVDATTLRITTTQPYWPLPITLSELWIIPPDVSLDALTQKAVGSGPYKMVEWVKDGRIVLQRNEEYWGGASGPLNVTLRPIPDDPTRIAALKAGEVDFINSVPPTNLADIQGTDLKAVETLASINYLGMQQLRPPFNNKQVRQAMNYGIDVGAAITGLMKDTTNRLVSPFMSATRGYDSSLQPYAYDPVRAKSMLSAAGYPNGFDTTLVFAPNLVGVFQEQQLAEYIAAQLGKIGVNAKLQPMDYVAFNSAISKGEYPMYMHSWPADNGGARYLETLFHSKSRGWYYQNPAADKLIDTYFSAPANDDAAITAAGKALNTFLYDESPWVPLMHFKAYYGEHQNVTWDAKPTFVPYIALPRIDKT
jgi:peptide/nickel transport system substrate-binding protein